MSVFVSWMVAIQLCCLGQDWSFIQVSDIHVPYSDSLTFIRSLQNVNTTYLEPYQVTAPKPAFVVATGDVTEFGGGVWNDYANAVATTGLPWYHAAGNHDNAWWNIVPDLQKQHGRPFYSWNYQGCHFVVLNSATPQEPLPTFGREQIEWLRQDLQNVSKNTPLFVFFHHPLGGSEFASSYEQLRVVELIRSYPNVFCIGGHYHSPKLSTYEGMPMIVGGQGYQALAGYMIFSIQNGWLRVAYRKMSEANAVTPILERQLVTSLGSAPELDLECATRSLESHPTLTLSYHIKNLSSQNTKTTKSATQKQTVTLLQIAGWETRASQQKNEIRIDDIWTGDFDLVSEQGTLSIPIPKELLPGQHFATVHVKCKEQWLAQTVCFEIADVNQRWTTQLPAACKAGISIGDHIYVPSLEGMIYALDKNSGNLVWSYPTQGMILGRLLVTSDSILAGSSDGKVYCLKKDGSLLWCQNLQVPIYAPLSLVEKQVIASDRQGTVYSLDLNTGRLLWQTKAAAYTIESRAYTSGGQIVVGAWDCYLTILRDNDGTIVNRTKGVGSATKPAPTYYSPADCRPIIADGKLYATDRAYILGEWELSTLTLLRQWTSIAAIALSQDGQALYLRKTTGELQKMGLDGQVLWTITDIVDSVPIAPVEYDGKVYVCSNKGKFSILSSTTGQIIAQHQITSGLRVYGEVAVDASGIYIADMDGKVTALQHP